MNIEYSAFSGEYAEIVEIENECFTDPWTLSMFRESAESELNYFYTARCNGRICGYILAGVISPEAEIMSIAVKGEFRKMGIAERLIRDFIASDMMKENEAIYLEVRVSNSAAIGLYEKIGFERLGIRKNYYRLPKEDALVMAYFSDREGKE